jgi:hypothetical protein
MRFELKPDMVASAKAGKNILVGIDHENYAHQVLLEETSRVSLVNDLA